MSSDFRYAFRQLAKSPGFTAVAVLTLAIAIGVNSSVFSIADRLQFRPLIREHPEQIVSLFTGRQGADRDWRRFTYEEFMVIREARDVFAEVTAAQDSVVGIGREETLHRNTVLYCADSYFRLLEAQPWRGRFFTAEECAPGAGQAVAIASHALWQRLGQPDGLVGSTLRIDDLPYTVVGIAPQGFAGTNRVLAPEAWLPLGMIGQARGTDTPGDPGLRNLFNPRRPLFLLTARLQSGVTLANFSTHTRELDARLNALAGEGADRARELIAAPPARNDFSLQPKGDESILVGPALVGMALVVLLIASLNLANLLLARGVARQQEIAIRLSVGASRWRIVRQLFVEGLVLSVIGGAIGLLLSLWCNDLLVQAISAQFSTQSFSYAIDLAPDRRVLAATLAYGLVATVVFSLWPAWRATKINLVSDLKRQAGETGGAPRWARFFSAANCLVMVQVALSLALIFGSALFLRSVHAASHVTLGFVAEHRLLAELDYGVAKLSRAEVARREQAVLNRAAGLPGVERAALSTQTPYETARNEAPVQALGTTAGPENLPQRNGVFTAVMPGYFDTMGIALLRGRDFTAPECTPGASPTVAIVDETLARQLFGAEDALGRRVKFAGAKGNGLEVIGIVRSPRHSPSDAQPPVRIYVPLPQSFGSRVYLHVRLAASAAPATVLATLRHELRALEPDLPLLQALPMTEFLQRNMELWELRITATFFGVFGALALGLAVVGLYSVKTYAVIRRTREIGIRMALGAQSPQVMALIVKQSLLQTALGLLVGCGLALGVGRVLGSMLYKISPADPLALGGAALVLLGATLFACWLPARRATRVNPTEALRAE
jgi:predicted permease